MVSNFFKNKLSTITLSVPLNIKKNKNKIGCKVMQVSPQIILANNVLLYHIGNSK